VIGLVIGNERTRPPLPPQNIMIISITPFPSELFDGECIGYDFESTDRYDQYGGRIFTASSAGDEYDTITLHDVIESVKMIITQGHYDG
jgi:hypothetical protein